MHVRRTAVLLTVAATTAVVAVAGPAAAGADPPELISVSRTGAQGNSVSNHQAISADGRYVVFESEANDLVPNDFNVATDVFLRDRQTATTSLLSRSAAGGEANGDSGKPSISADGRYVAFHSAASNLVPGDTNESQDIFVLDRSTGVTTRISKARSGAQANGRSDTPAISANGRYVAYLSQATNLVPGHAGEPPDVLVYDRWTGATTGESFSRVGQGEGSALDIAISADGRFVAFTSVASDLVPGDTNNAPDVFFRDRRTKVTTRIDVSTDGVQAGVWSESYGVSISADGRYVAYESSASNLVPGDTNNRSDIFRRDVRAGITSRVSVTGAGAQANDASFVGSISADGRLVAFGSYATNLAPGDTTTNSDVFVRDVRAGTTTAVTALVADGVQDASPTISADGRYVAFTSWWPEDPAYDTIDVFVARYVPE